MACVLEMMRLSAPAGRPMKVHLTAKVCQLESLSEIGMLNDIWHLQQDVACQLQSKHVADRNAIHRANLWQKASWQPEASG